MTPKELNKWFRTSPYYKVACKMIYNEKIDDPTPADMFEAFHEIAKVDNKINQGK